jgi:murein L,D-transpeptidase YafK
MAQAHELQAFGNSSKKSKVAVRELQDEARARIGHYLSNQQSGALPNLLMVPSAQQRYVIVIDTDKSRLYLYSNENGFLTHAADYYITVGKNGVAKQSEGDKRTPIGVYFAGKKLTQPLDDIYGDAAFPLNYPNEWDAEHGKKGSGIWLHGTPSNTFSRPPRASDGCVVLTNEDIKTLSPILQTGRTPVIIANHLKWLGAESKSNEKKALKEALDSWLQDWKSQNMPKYLSHYSHNFSSDGVNYQQWSKRKFSVQASKANLEISLSDISMFSYPDNDKNLVVIDFVHDFKSANLTHKIQKRQYWIQENNIWKIIYEGSV